ncbi:hypothetical protein PIB30_079918 [Stylosanthes scabra]|uniref:Uncharacterized protein n=1 Tax=Stylosanthes scabra TaxID=79078 RepID=A0ABU6QRR8_9FABA|nr:hypothetical protein [Stylosanthes scabra]
MRRATPPYPKSPSTTQTAKPCCRTPYTINHLAPPFTTIIAGEPYQTEPAFRNHHRRQPPRHRLLSPSPSSSATITEPPQSHSGEVISVAHTTALNHTPQPSINAAVKAPSPFQFHRTTNHTSPSPSFATTAIPSLAVVLNLVPFRSSASHYPRF